MADLDPTTFTKFRNYYYDEIALWMPEDNIYAEEDDEEDKRQVRAQ